MPPDAFTTELMERHPELAHLVEDATAAGELLTHILMSQLCSWVQATVPHTSTGKSAPVPLGLLELREDGLAKGTPHVQDAIAESFIQEFDAAPRWLRLNLASQGGRRLRRLFEELEAREARLTRRG